MGPFVSGIVSLSYLHSCVSLLANRSCVRESKFPSKDVGHDDFDKGTDEFIVGLAVAVHRVGFVNDSKLGREFCEFCMENGSLLDTDDSVEIDEASCTVFEIKTGSELR